MSPTDESAPDESEAPRREHHEETDVDPAQIVRWMLGIAAGVLVCVVVLAGGYAAASGIGFAEVFVPDAEQVEAPRPPEPQLESDPYALRRESETAARKRLGNYAWVDREEGIARIPIERAMQLVAQRSERESGGEGGGDRRRDAGGVRDAGRGGETQ